MNSLRWKLIAGILAAVTVVLACAGTLAFANIRERLYAEFDRTLLQRAVALKFSVRVDKGRIDVGRLDKGADLLGHEQGVDFFHVYQKDNGTLMASSQGTETALPRFAGPLDRPEYRDLMLPGGRKGRGVGIEFNARVDLTKKEKAARLEQGESLEPKGPLFELVLAKADTVAPILDGIRQLFIGIWVGCTLLSAGLVGWVVRRSLRPLAQLQAQIGGMQETVAGQRIALARPPAEVRPVVNELNRLLDRVEAALARERNLTSNVAHELRTPLAGMLSTLEVTLSQWRSSEEYRESAESCLEIVKRMNWLVNNLLSITRLEAGSVPLQREAVELEGALLEWWAPFAGRAGDRGLCVTWEITARAALVSDREFLRVVVMNLFDNAVSYTPEGGAVRIQADTRGTLSIANHAPGVKAGIAERVFDPFWRDSESREEVGQHAGLGLHLCRKIVALLGGTISARIYEQESTFEVRLALGDPQPRSDMPPASLRSGVR